VNKEPRVRYQVLSTSKLSRSATVGLHVMKDILNIMVELRESVLAVMITYRTEHHFFSVQVGPYPSSGLVRLLLTKSYF
jgi:hypothetical protein